MSEQLSALIQKEIEELDFKNHSLLLCREDGLIIFKKLNHQFDQATTGALLSGIWNAAKAIADFLPGKENNEVFRLSFDTSSRGLHILPATFAGKSCFWTLIFHNEDNPAPYKVKLRSLARKLEKIEDLSENTPSAGRIFSELSDEEIDSAFKKMRKTCPS